MCERSNLKRTQMKRNHSGNNNYETGNLETTIMNRKNLKQATSKKGTSGKGYTGKEIFEKGQPGQHGQQNGPGRSTRSRRHGMVNTVWSARSKSRHGGGSFRAILVYTLRCSVANYSLYYIYVVGHTA